MLVDSAGSHQGPLAGPCKRCNERIRPKKFK